MKTITAKSVRTVSILLIAIFLSALTVRADMALVPAGSFSMGDHNNADMYNRETPVHEVYISAFFIDKYEVSKAKWDEVYSWAVANGYSFDDSGSGTATNHPVHSISWYDCIKWCNARSEKQSLNPLYFTDTTKTTVYRTGQIDLVIDAVNWNGNGYRLPTEAEWEKAARGGLSSNYYPWASQGGSYSNHIDGSKANYYNNGGPWDNDTSPCGYYDGNQTPSGTNMANGYGLYDMAGNVCEWVFDKYSTSWYSQAGATNANTRGPATVSQQRVYRNGSSSLNTYFARCARRSLNLPEHSNNFTGFRCVRLFE